MSRMYTTHILRIMLQNAKSPREKWIIMRFIQTRIEMMDNNNG